jgi:hypothetical protein
MMAQCFRTSKPTQNSYSDIFSPRATNCWKITLRTLIRRAHLPPLTLPVKPYTQNYCDASPALNRPPRDFPTSTHAAPSPWWYSDAQWMC